jgi:hypothetical protein
VCVCVCVFFFLRGKKGFIASSKRFAPGHEFRHSLVPIAKKHGVQVFGEIVGSRIDDKYETLNR